MLNSELSYYSEVVLFLGSVRCKSRLRPQIEKLRNFEARLCRRRCYFTLTRNAFT